MKQPHIYLIASYTIRPRIPYMTRHAGYILQDENIQYSESVTIARTLKTRDITQSQVIIDIAQEKIIKCSYQGTERSYQALMEYYLKHYPNYVRPILEKLGRLPVLETITEIQETTVIQDSP